MTEERIRETYEGLRSEYEKAIRELQKLDYLKMSEEQFLQVNKQLKSMDDVSRNKLMRDVIGRLVLLKLELSGFGKEDREAIARQLLVNWNKIIEAGEAVKFSKLIAVAKRCWAKKGVQLTDAKHVKKTRPKRYIGLSRLVGAGTIIAFDSKGLYYNPTEQVFLSSYWVALVMFHDGTKEFFNL